MSATTMRERLGLPSETPLKADQRRDAVLKVNRFIVRKHGLESREGERVVADPRTPYYFWDGTGGADLATGTTSGTYRGDPYVLSTSRQHSGEGNTEDRTFQVVFAGKFQSFGATVEGLEKAREIIEAESIQSDPSQ